jgi:hypothetical protein
MTSPMHESLPIAAGRRARDRGYSGVFLLLALIAVTVGGVSLLSYSRPPSATLKRESLTTEALAQARDALVAYAASRGQATGSARPGELPCPDTKLATDPLYGTEDATCLPGALGRVPWKTLGIAEPKDSAGETLWYAVAGPFRRNPPNTGVINSDTRGNVVVYAADGVTPVTTEAVAVLFAPGPPVGRQSRSLTATALCATTGTTLAQHSCAANYLDAVANRNNATANGPFIAGTVAANGPTYNDRVLVLTSDDVLPAVETRVAQELKKLFEAYRVNSKCKCYPWAADFTKDLTAAALPNAESRSVDGRNRGRVPTRARPKKWGNGAIPLLPQWFTYNNWQNVIYYGVARQNTNGGGKKCSTCDSTPMLNVAGNGVSLVFLTPGSPAAGITRPSNTLANYLQDSQNNDHSNDIYVMPTATGRSRDRITTALAAASLASDSDDDDDDD